MKAYDCTKNELLWKNLFQEICLDFKEFLAFFLEIFRTPILRKAFQ